VLVAGRTGILSAVRRALFIAVAAVAGGMLVGALGAASEARRSPALRLADRQPLTLRGVHFRARELVRVQVTADSGTRTRRVRTTASGSFVSQFGPVLDRCSGLYAVAVGSRGSRATLKMPQPLCPPS
jgi:hypothetical protein